MNNEIQSPLGSFPSINSGTVLQFDETEDDATQGNSNGEVNSPKVVSCATFVCAVCDINFKRKEEVNKHMDETHVTVSQQLQDDNEALEEAGEEQDLNDLYDHFEMLSQELKLSEKDHEPSKDLVEKIERFKAILKKKDEIFKETKVKLVNEIKATEHRTGEQRTGSHLPPFLSLIFG